MWSLSHQTTREVPCYHLLKEKEIPVTCMRFHSQYIMEHIYIYDIYIMIIYHVSKGLSTPSSLIFLLHHDTSNKHPIWSLAFPPRGSYFARNSVILWDCHKGDPLKWSRCLPHLPMSSACLLSVEIFSQRIRLIIEVRNVGAMENRGN